MAAWDEGNLIQAMARLKNPTILLLIEVLRALIAMLAPNAPRFFSFRVFHPLLASVKQRHILNFDQNILKNKVILVEICRSKLRSEQKELWI